MEPVHRRLGINGVDRNGRPGKHDEVNWAIADDLVGDVDVAAPGVASPRSLRHGLNLVHA